MATKLPTYHRQRSLLMLLRAAGGVLSKLDLQKLMFLYVQDSGSRHYSFVPFRFGCYSFQAASDLALLEKQGWLVQSANELNLDVNSQQVTVLESLPEYLQISGWLKSHPLRGRSLIRDVYRRYPWYATRSEIKDDLLSRDEIAQVEAMQCQSASIQPILFTIGYEGIDFEEYGNRLLRAAVKLVCDVRANPLSRKFGFSKSALSRLLSQLGIQYVHLPELGISSDRRRNLKEPGEFRGLFDEYRRELPAKESGLERVSELFAANTRIALTCFEEHPSDCHRHCVTEFLAAKSHIRVEHL